MPLHLSCTIIIKVKMNGCFVLVFIVCGLARSIHLNINCNYNYVEPVHVTMIDWVCAINSVAASGDKTAYALLWER